jgi:hypothetical protein
MNGIRLIAILSFKQKAILMPKLLYLLIFPIQCVILYLAGVSIRITSLFHPQLMRLPGSVTALL